MKSFADSRTTLESAVKPRLPDWLPRRRITRMRFGHVIGDRAHDWGHTQVHDWGHTQNRSYVQPGANAYIHSGNANATYSDPEGGPNRPPPAAMTMNCLPPARYTTGVE